MLIEALFESDEQLFEFLTGTLAKIPGVLQNETYHVLQTVKINYDWKLPLDHDDAGSRDARNGRPRAGRGPAVAPIRTRPAARGSAAGRRPRATNKEDR
jgi:hypothetical protein